MAFNWGAAESQKNWSTEEQLEYVNNKKKAEKFGVGSDEYRQAKERNDEIRASHGIYDDNYNAADAEDAFVFNTQVNPYLRKSEEVNFNIDNSRVKKAKNAIENFQYNPEDDVAFKKYREQMGRESASAAKSTINQLNAANMGRNSSYGAAATAQVQQAYAQKVADKATELAEQAYQKLINLYNIEKSEYDSEYARKNDEYGRYIDRANTDLYRWSTVEQLRRAEEQHDKNMITADLKNKMLGVDADMYQKEKDLAYDSGVKENKMYDKELGWYDERTLAELEAMDADTTGQQLSNASVYAGINAANEFLKSNGLVDSSGNCTVIWGGTTKQMNSSEVAAGLFAETIDIDENGNLIYVGG